MVFVKYLLSMTGFGLLIGAASILVYDLYQIFNPDPERFNMESEVHKQNSTLIRNDVLKGTPTVAPTAANQ